MLVVAVHCRELFHGRMVRVSIPLTLTHTLTTEFGENEFCENCEFTAPVKIPATTRKSLGKILTSALPK